MEYYTAEKINDLHLYSISVTQKHNIEWNKQVPENRIQYLKRKHKKKPVKTKETM